MTKSIQPFPYYGRLHYILIPLASFLGLIKQLALIWRLNERDLGYYSLIFASSTFITICIASGHASLLASRIATVNKAFRLKYSLKLASNFSSICLLRILTVLGSILLLSVFIPSLSVYLLATICALPLILSLFTINLFRFNLSPPAFSFFLLVRSFLILFVVVVCLFLQVPIHTLISLEFLLYIAFFPLGLLFVYLDSRSVHMIHDLYHNLRFFLNNTCAYTLSPLTYSRSYRHATSYGLSDVMSSSMSYVDKIIVRQMFGFEMLGMYSVICYPIVLASMTSAIFVQCLQAKFYQSSIEVSKHILSTAFLFFLLLQLFSNFLFFNPSFQIHPLLTQARQVPFVSVLVSLICIAYFYPVIMTFLVGRECSNALIRSSILCIVTFLFTLSISLYISSLSLNISTVLLALAVAYVFQFLFLSATVHFSSALHS